MGIFIERDKEEPRLKPRVKWKNIAYALLLIAVVSLLMLAIQVVETYGKSVFNPSDECSIEICDSQGFCKMVRIYNITHESQRTYPKTDCMRLKEICNSNGKWKCEWFAGKFCKCDIIS